MILVGDSGSTKTDWRLIENNQIKSQHACKGLNPHFHSSDTILEEIKICFDLELSNQVSEVHFYGSGCSTDEKKQIVSKGFKAHFTKAKLFIEHDLLGAARAACGKQKGLSGILGTGSNCCLYDGISIIQENRSGGFMIGDEGGGVHIGKLVLKNYIEKRFSEDLMNRFEKRYQTNYDEILTNLYKKTYPNRYMASFSRFAYHNRKEQVIQEMILNCFRAYFENQVCRFEAHQKLPLNLVGSIAFYYQDLIRAVAEEYTVRIGAILEKPISGIANFHLDLD